MLRSSSPTAGNPRGPRGIAALALLSLSFLTCDHPFPEPPPRGDVADRDPDGAVADHRPADRRAADRGASDRAPIDACTSTPPSGAPTGGACDTLAGWFCLGTCGGVDRFVCFQGASVRLELACDTNGDCTCHDGAKHTACTGLPVTGRTGCARGREAFDSGCCK